MSWVDPSYEGGVWQDVAGVAATTGEARFTNTDTTTDGVARRFYWIMLVLRWPLSPRTGARTATSAAPPVQGP